jgi:uncharacterized protein (DUF1800 family)
MADKIDPKWAWDPFVPGAKNPWTLKQVGHVYRRAGFGATLTQLQNGVKLGPDLVPQLFKPAQASPSYDAATDQYLSTAARKFNTGQQAAGWWLYRMLHGNFALREKLSLFWHNHFATSQAKVQNVGHMVRHYELIHSHALGDFRQLLHGMTIDPAMMIWLDTIQSKKGMPNENYARELMELFSLGIGNYTENDIREAARAFTGWEIRDGKFFNNKAQFDSTPKTVFGKNGNFTGQDIVDLCLQHKACPKFIVRKL